MSKRDRRNRPRRYVYIIEAGETGRYKVGIAARPRERLKGLQTGSAWPLHIRHVHSTGAAMRTEQLIHALLADHRLLGEWFECSLPTIKAAIRRAEEIRPRGKVASKGRHWKTAARNEAEQRSRVHDLATRFNELQDLKHKQRRGEATDTVK